MGRLRDLLRGVQCPAIKGVDEGSEIPMSGAGQMALPHMVDHPWDHH